MYIFRIICPKNHSLAYSIAFLLNFNIIPQYFVSVWKGIYSGSFVNKNVLYEYTR